MHFAWSILLFMQIVWQSCFSWYSRSRVQRGFSSALHQQRMSLSGAKRAAASDSGSPRKRAAAGSDAVVSDSTPPLSFVPEAFHPARARVLTSRNVSISTAGNCVVYWMSRDQRVHDNHAFFYAQSLARNKSVPLRVVFNLVPRFLEATIRQFGFMIRGLREVEETLRSLNISFYLLQGQPVGNVCQFAKDMGAVAVVVDFSPLRVGRGWVAGLAQKLDHETSIPVIQVDAHNVVPCWVASPKLEYSAKTFRGKITPKIAEFIRPVPPPEPQTYPLDATPVDWDAALAGLEVNRDVEEVSWLQSGYCAGMTVLRDFISTRLRDYGDKRNDPNANAVSHLSPYIHFGQISVERAVMELRAAKKSGSSVDSFVEEAVVRREVAENFCYYNAQYDSVEGCYPWARETLRLHSADPRQYLYSLEQLEQAKTHDDLWNAAQLQMVNEGKMHGFLRMYWAKKILEWTASPEEALAHAIFLNDKYELDGRDPNGYVGCMWSICGTHDQGWGERPIFGKIRYMNYEGCKRKFDVAQFVRKYPPAAANAAAAQGQRTLR